jgi:hypothetical protein
MTEKLEIGQEIEIRNNTYIIQTIIEKPLSGILVGLRKPKGKAYYAVRTDGQGRFTSPTKIG